MSDKKYKNPLPCVSILIISDGKVLLGRRSLQSRIKPGLWSLPCGYIEFRENYIDAAVREVKEETSLDVRIKAIINVVSNHYDDDIGSLVIVLLAECISDPALAIGGDDIESVMWHSLSEELPEMAFQGDVHIIGQYIKYGEDFGIPMEKTEYEFFEKLK